MTCAGRLARLPPFPRILQPLALDPLRTSSLLVVKGEGGRSRTLPFAQGERSQTGRGCEL